MLGARTTLPPGPFYSTPFVAGRELRRDPLGMTLRVWREYGDTTCIRMGPLRFYMAFHPDDVKHVLQENNQNYVKGALIARARVLVGNGLFSSEGPFWRRQRRLMQPAFHRQRIAGFVDTLVACTTRALDRWEPHAEAGTVFDVADEMNRLTLTIVGQTLFSRDLSNEAGPAGAALARVLALTAERVMSYLVWPLWVPTHSNRELLRNRRVLDEVVLGVIEGRRRGETRGEDLLAMLIEARDEETGAGMTNQQLRDEAITFFLAGHETTAVATSWAWYLLDRHPEVAERLRADVERVLGDRPPTLDDMPALGYARMVIQEAMRLYPPLWGLARETLGPDRVGGYDVPAGRIVSLSPYVTHRHPDFWDDPERFDPERFTPERIAARHKFAYLPFGGGPRLCIGNEFALTEAQIILAMTVQRYRLRYAGAGPIALDPSLTLRPRGGVPMRAERVGRGATRPRRLAG
jgi:cytochrome P450